jgi:hypothetical protein
MVSSCQMKGLGIRSNGFHVFLSDFFFESASAKAVKRHLLRTALCVVCSSALLWLRIITRGLSLTISVLEFQCVLDFRCFLGPAKIMVPLSHSYNPRRSPLAPSYTCIYMLIMLFICI